MTKIELTDELRAEILGLIEQGYSVRYIYNKVGISNTVFYRWQDEDDDFREQCQRARRNALKDMRTEAEDCIKSKMESREDDSWRAAAWFLSHKHPSEYAERRIQENTGEAAPFDRLLETLSNLKAKETETE